MGYRIESVRTNTVVNSTIVTTALTVLAQIGPINVPVDFADVWLWWYFWILIGTGGNLVAALVYRELQPGAVLVNVSEGISVVAGGGYAVSGCYFDTPGRNAEQFYTLRVLVEGATGNSTCGDVAFMAACL